MNIKNPFVKGSAAFQNFNADILANQHEPLGMLVYKRNKLKEKADNFLNYSDAQRCSFDNEIKAVQALIDVKISN